MPFTLFLYVLVRPSRKLIVFHNMDLVCVIVSDVNETFLPESQTCLTFHGHSKASEQHGMTLVFWPVLMAFQLKREHNKSLLVMLYRLLVLFERRISHFQITLR